MSRAARRTRLLVATCAALAPVAATVVWASDRAPATVTYRSMAAVGRDSAVVLDQTGHLEGLGAARSIDLAGPSSAVDVESDPSGTGFQILHADGTIEPRAAARLSCAASTGTGHAFVALALRPSGTGAWALRDDGQIETCGDAPPVDPPAPIPGERGVGLTASTDGGGYWVLTDRGTVNAAGTAVAAGNGDDFRFDPTIVPCTGTYCGTMALYANGADNQPWAPYTVTATQHAITTQQNNHWTNNHYTGPWTYTTGFGTTIDWATWQSGLTNQDTDSTMT